MRQLLRDRDRLLRAQVILKERARTRSLSVAELEALAESGFRLAVHPQTSAEEALALLRRCLQIDGANPKYAYHLARLLFVRGEVQLAAEWLRHAACLCPTSHRIWAHISLLQRRLNALYGGNERYETDALRQRGEKIVAAIQQGKDRFDPGWIDFVPPISRAAREEESRQARERPIPEPARNGEARSDIQAQTDRPLPSANARRMVHGGQCRWSGVIDLSIEQLLEGKPSQSTLEQIIPLLEQVARYAGQRRGGVAAFVILALQWLVCGYPVSTIRRLSVDLKAAEDFPAAELLKRVCTLFEAPEEEIGPQLAAALEQGRIPPLLAALIHRQRLLSRPLKFAVNTYQSVRRLLAAQPDLKDDAANEQIKRLGHFLGKLYPTLATPLKDQPRARAAAQVQGTPAERLAALESAAQGLTTINETLFAFLKEKLEPVAANVPDQTAYAQARADLQACRSLLDLLVRRGEEGNQRLDELIKGMASLAESDRPGDLETRKDNCKNTFTELCNPGNCRRSLNRVEKHLTTAAARFQEMPCQSSADLTALLAAAERTLPRAADAPADASSGSAVEQLAALEQAASKLTTASQQAFDFLKEKLDPAAKKASDQAAYAQAHADGQAFDELLATLRLAGEEGTRRLDDVMKGMVSLDESKRPADLETRKDNCKNTFTELSGLGNFTGILNRVKKNLTAAAAHFQEQPCQPSADLTALRDSVAEVFPARAADGASGATEAAGSRPTPTRPNPVKRLEGLRGVEGLREALAIVEEEVARVFTDARQTFAVYSLRVRRLPPLAALWSQVCSRQAETLYRLGLRRQARGVWNELLFADRLDIRILRNLAVCDTGGDIARCLASWRSYAEMLYLLDVVADSPRPHARLRADFHRSFGASYAPSFLSAKLDGDWDKKLDDEATLAMIAFLNSPGRVRHFVSHTLLAFLNARLDFHSPPLILGLSRGEALKMREQGRKSFLAFADRLTPELPERVRPVFPKLLGNHLEGAVEACAAARRLTSRADPRYEEEKTRLEHLLQEAWHLKFKLFRFATDYSGDNPVISERVRRVARGLTSVDFLAELARLDDIPLDASPEFFATILRGQKPEMVRSFVQKNVNEVLVVCLLEFIFGEGDGQDEARQRQYRRLIDEWSHLPALADHLDRIDDPHFAYPPAVVEALSNQGSPVEPALAALKRLRERFPELTGPHRMSAHLLAKDRPAEAVAVLDEAISKGFHAPAVQLCRAQRMWLHMHLADAAAEKKESEKAMTALEKVREEADHLIAHGGKAELVHQGRQARMLGGLKLGNVAADANDTVRAERGYDDACTTATDLIAHHLGGGAPDVDELAQCHFYRMLAWYHRAMLSSQAGNRAETKRRLQQAKQDAQHIVQLNRVPDQVKQAKDLLKQIDDIITRLS